MIIKNPTEQKISVTIFGDVLSVDSMGSVTVTDEQGSEWLKVHEFLIEGSEEAPKAVKKEKVEKKEVEKKEVKKA